MGGVHPGKKDKNAKPKKTKPVFDDQKDPNPIFGNIGNVRVITYSCFALQNLFLSIGLSFPKEILKEILLQMREIPKAKKSKGRVMTNESYKVIVFGAGAGKKHSDRLFNNNIFNNLYFYRYYNNIDCINI